MIVITDRDKKIKEFLEVVKVADTQTISILFFNNSLRGSQKRLKQLTEIKYIKCFRPSIIEQNIYYSKNKPTNYPHKIAFSKLLAKLKLNGIELLKYKCPYKIGDIISDGLIVIRKNDKVQIYFVEAERTKKLNIDKYQELYYSRKWKEFFPIMPSILCISDKNINTKHEVLEIKKCKWNLEDLNI